MKRKAGREKQQDPWKLPDWDSYSDSIVNTNDLYSISDVEEKEEVSGHFSQPPSLIAHEYPFRSNFYHGSTQNKTSPVSQTSSKRNESSSLSSLGSDISFRSLRRPLSAVSQTSMNNLASQQIKITQQLKHVQARFEDLKNKINAEGKENVNKLRNQYEKNMIENFTQTQNDEVERCLLARLEQMKKTLDYVSGSYQIDPTEVENAISLGKNALMPHQFHLELPLLSRKLPVVFPLFDQRNCQEVKKEDQTEIERHLYEMERSCLNHFHEVDKMVRRKEASFQECFQRLQEFYTLQQQKLVNEIIHQFKQKSSKMKKKTRLIDEELQKKKTEVEEIQTELSRSQMEKENLIVQLDTLRNELLKMTEELQNTKKNMEKQQIKIHTYEQDNHALKDEIISLKSMLSQKELEVCYLLPLCWNTYIECDICIDEEGA
jgi:chromosome segregation ATPase